MSWSEFYLGFPRSRMAMDRYSSVIDIGCRDLRSHGPLLNYLAPDGSYLGVDVDGEAIDRGHQRLVEGLIQEPEFGPRWRCVFSCRADDFGEGYAKHLERRPTVALTFALLLHLDNDQVVELGNALKRIGVSHWYADLNLRFGDEVSGTWNGFPCIRRPLWLYDDLLSRSGWSIHVCGEVRDFCYTGTGMVGRNLAVEITGQ